MKTWFQNRRMKHKKLNRKGEDGQDISGDDECDDYDVTDVNDAESSMEDVSDSSLNGSNIKYDIPASNKNIEHSLLAAQRHPNAAPPLVPSSIVTSQHELRHALAAHAQRQELVYAAQQSKHDTENEEIDVVSDCNWWQRHNVLDFDRWNKYHCCATSAVHFFSDQYTQDIVLSITHTLNGMGIFEK